MRTRFGPFTLFGAFTGSGVIAISLGALPVPYSVGLVILGLFVFSWSAWTSILGATSALVCSALFADGFLFNRLGRLRWTGRIDAAWLAVLVAAALLGIAGRLIAMVLRYEEPVFRPVERKYARRVLAIRPHRSA